MVCIIDDDKSVLRALKRLITSAGYPVVGFSSAEDFLGSEHANDTACLVVDVQLPGLDGLELQEKLMAAARRMSIIFISAFDDAPARTRALDHGALAFLKKPFDDRLLLEAIERGIRPGDSASSAPFSG